MRVVYTSSDKMFRIVERPDVFATLEALKGDMFNRDINPDISEEQMVREEESFEALVEREGVYGYILEQWDPSPGCGYGHVDSCWGFLGAYDPNDPNHNHEIVSQFVASAWDMAKEMGLPR